MTSSAEAARRWRQRHPDRQRVLAIQQAARLRARIRLSYRHLDEFQQLYDEELAARGGVRSLNALPPVPLDRRTVAARAETGRE